MAEFAAGIAAGAAAALYLIVRGRNRRRRELPYGFGSEEGRRG